MLYALNSIDASLVIRDTPLFYTPPRGPAAELTLAYKSREVLLPEMPTFWSLGPKWTSSWLSFALEALSTVGVFGDVNPEYVGIFLRGGGEEKYVGPPAGDGRYPRSFRTGAQLVRVSTTPIRYERRLGDGSIEVFAQPDGAPAGQWRRVFLTEVIDPQGQRLQFSYDAQLRLVAMTDAVGQVTTLAYEDAADPLRVTRIADPFGRTAHLTYTEAGQLASITDMLGLVSSFTYGPSDFIVALKTPDGTTTFRHESTPTEAVWYPFVEATDALGGTERLEFRWEDAALPASDPAAAVPTGFAASNTDLHKYNTLYWDARAWARGPGDVTTATLTHWLQWETYPGSLVWQSDPTPHSVKRPLENRVWYAYPGQATPIEVGTLGTPSVTARVLDDGTTQASTATYNDLGQVVTRTDPLGRQTTYSYAANGIDVLEVRQTTPGVNDLLASYSNYNSLHQPGTVTDAAGQTTSYTYNAAGQVLTVTTPARSGISENRTTTYAYDADGRLETVTRPAEGATATYTYDSFGRVRTITDEDAYTITTDYDALNRPTRVTYPDGTYEETTYDKLHVGTRRDRLGRLTRYTADALGRLIATRDPAGRQIVQEWDGPALRRLTDANGRATTWERDAAGRVMREIRADGLTTTTYTYEATTSRLKTVTDPKQQVTTYTYNPDDTIASTVYSNAQIATPSVSFTYDPAYNRVATMVDGTGTTTYTYQPAGALGAGQVASVDGPLPNDTISYTYDELGRVVSRAINGVAASHTYDALGRVRAEANVLGTFTYGYEGVTGRLASVAYPNGQTSTYSYLPNAQDHRLEAIHHKYPNGATLSRFDYAYDVFGNILTWRQQADTTAVVWEYGYDQADQLTAAIKKATDPQGTILQRYYYRYDSAGNRLSEQIDDQITSWTYDSLNRLVTQTPGGLLKVKGQLNEAGTVTVNGQSALVSSGNLFEGHAQLGVGTTPFTITAADLAGNITTQQYEMDTAGASKVFTFDANGNFTSDGTRTFEWDARNQLVAVTVGTHRTEFAYDGSQRRVRVVEKENSVVQSDAHVLWCGPDMCEEREAGTGQVVRRYFERGVQEGGQALFYHRDHRSSVVGMTDASGVARARYDYSPYGEATKTAGDLESTVGFGGYRATTNGADLWLSLYRAYDVRASRWASEDPIGDEDDINRYRFVMNGPISAIDPLGLACTPIARVPVSPWFIESVQRIYHGKWQFVTWNTIGGGGPVVPGAPGGLGTLQCFWRRPYTKITNWWRTVAVVWACDEPCKGRYVTMSFETERTTTREERMDTKAVVRGTALGIQPIPPDWWCKTHPPQ